ncbi:MAG: zinc ribbon domain-containing protein, partial [Nitriliruptorales bacterium]|nr:zinc ribbon domain-containing protein [Nitriliruptorales bacterium]
MTRTCGNCGTEIEDDWQFCLSCGAQLDDTGSAAVADEAGSTATRSTTESTTAPIETDADDA